MFVFFISQRKWRGAQAYCRSYGMDLVSIESGLEDQLILDELIYPSNGKSAVGTSRAVSFQYVLFFFLLLFFLQNLSGRRVRTKVAKAGGRGRRPERTLRTRTGRPESRTTKTAASTTPSPTKPASAGGPTGTRAPSSTLCAKLRVPRTQRRDRLEYTSGSGPGTARVVVVVDTTARWLPPRPPPPVDGTMVMDDIRAESIIRS